MWFGEVADLTLLFHCPKSYPDPRCYRSQRRHDDETGNNPPKTTNDFPPAPAAKGRESKGYLFFCSIEWR